MSTATLINIRTDLPTKQSISEYAKEHGLTMSQFMLQASRIAMKRKNLVIEPLLPEPSLAKILRQADKDIASGKNITRHKSAEALFAHLDGLKQK